MQLRKKIISFLLIFAYSTGFAHEMIPHIHLDDEIHNHHELSVPDHHHLENHSHTESNDGNNVIHLNHLDDSIYDYLICLLSSVDHTECYASYEVNFPSFDLDNSENQSNKNFVTNVYFCLIETEFSYSKTAFYTYDEWEYLFPIAESDPNRGPPNFSC